MGRAEIEIGGLVRVYQAKTGKLLTIGTAESATGGRIADELTSIEGSSDYFKGSVVAYGNEINVAVLKVQKETIEKYGAVSSQTAVEMAEGGRRLLNVDICVSDTGIAGPTGDSPEKPVGLFHLGLATNDGSLSEEHVFHGDREENKRDAAEAALNIVKQYLIQCITKQEHN